MVNDVQEHCHSKICISNFAVDKLSVYAHIRCDVGPEIVKPMPDRLNFANCSCFNLRRAARRVTQVYDHALAPSGLKATQFALLAVLEGDVAGEGIAMTRLELSTN